jgi:hypothetical protein
MPNPLVSPFGKRQPRALVIGLRRVVKDPKATVTQRLEACKLLAVVEGYIEPRSRDRVATVTEPLSLPQCNSNPPQAYTASANRLRELLEIANRTA